MKYTFDITADQFQILEFREGVVAFNPATVCRSPWSLLAWGVVLNQWAALDLFGPNGNLLPAAVRSHFPCPLYFAEWGKVNFQAVRNLAMRLTPIAPNLEGKLQFLTHDGCAVVVEKQCAIGETIPEIGNNPPDAVWYEIATYLERPYGDLYLSVLASGRITFEVDLAGCVPFAHYLANAAGYDFDAYREHGPAISQSRRHRRDREPA